MKTSSSLEPLEARIAPALLTARWINPSGGLWSDAANWDLIRVPNNDATDTFDVIIDIGGLQLATIELTQSFTVRSLTNAEDVVVTAGTFTVTDATSNSGFLEANNAATHLQLAGNIDTTGVVLAVAGRLTIGPGSTVNASTDGGAIVARAQPMTLTNVTLRATAGGVIDLPVVTSFTGGAGSVIEAIGAGSRIDLSGLDSLSGGAGVGGPIAVRALSGGKVELGGEVSGAALTVNAPGSTIDVADVTSLTDTAIAATGGATFLFPPGASILLNAGVDMEATGFGSRLLNRALLTTASTVTIAGPFTNEGELNPRGGVFDIEGDLLLNAGGVITGDALGRVRISGNFLGNAIDSGTSLTQAGLVFDGVGTVQILEVMSADQLGSAAGFASNFAFRLLEIAPGASVRIVDGADNAAGGGREVLYVQTLNVPAGATLDLDGRGLYAAAQNVAGTVQSGAILAALPPQGTLQLRDARLVVSEGALQVQVVVTRTASANGEVSVRFVTSDGSASGGTHFTPVARTVTFADGDVTPKTVTIPLANDDIAEADRAFTVALANASAGVAIGRQHAATVTILDDDLPPAITLENTVVGLEENAGRVSFLVTRTGARGAPASVDYRFVAGTAIVGVDFTATAGTLHFAANETTKVITFAVERRLGAQDFDRRFLVELADPVGADLGERPSTTVTIKDVPTDTITPGKPLTLDETDRDRVVITVSKGSIPRGDIVVMYQDGEIVIPLIDLSKNRTLDGARFSLREIAAPALRGGLPGPPAGGPTPGPPPIGDVEFPEDGGPDEFCTPDSDVTKMNVPAKSNLRRIEVGSVAEFRERFPEIFEPGIEVESGRSRPILLVVNGDIAGVPVSLPDVVTAFVVRGNVTGGSEVTLGTKIGKFQIGGVTNATFHIAAPLKLMTVREGIDGGTFYFHSRIRALVVGGDVAGSNFHLLQGGAGVALRGEASVSSVQFGGPLGTLSVGGDATDFGVKAVEPPESTTGAAKPPSLGRLLIGGSASGLQAHSDTTLGVVKVGGDWIASSVSVGGDEESRIGAIVVRGMVLGTLDSVSSSDQFGFFAEEIGAFTVGTTKFPLTSGADHFAVGATGDVSVHESGASLPTTPPTPAGLTFTNANRTATFTDVDGDLVTVTTTKGAFDASQFTLAPAGTVGGRQLQRLDLHAATGFAGATITITATRSATGGDGWVNVGSLDAREDGTGIDLGKVVIEGDLGQIDAGDGDATKPALGAVVVHALGRFGLSTQQPSIGSRLSDFAGGVGTVVVTRDLLDADFSIVGGSIRAVRAGGDMVESVIATDSTLGAVSVRGDVTDSIVSALGPIFGAKTRAIGSFSIGGDFESSRLFAGIDAGGTIGNPDAAIGKIRIGGDFRESLIVAAVSAGSDETYATSDDHSLPGDTALIARIASVVIGGSAVSGSVLGEEIGAARIDGTRIPFSKGPRNDEVEAGGIQLREVP